MRTVAAIALIIMAELWRQLGEALTESLPSDVHEAGVFLAGMVWALIMLLLVLLLAASAVLVLGPVL